MEDRSLKPLGRLGRTSRCGKSERTKVYCFFPEPLTGLTNGGNDYGYSQWHYQEDDRFCWSAASAHEVGQQKAEREFEIYRERKMRMLEGDFDKAVKRLKKQNDEDDKNEA